MKELSIEEKAKRYDETIEKLRNFYRDYDTVSRLIDVKEELANLIPELKESEDERIRKALIELVHDTTGDSLWVDYNVHKEDALAWLEKQGEKSTGEEIKEALRTEYEKGRADAIAEMQKPAWSEEDEKLLELSVENLTELKDRFGKEYGRTGDCIDWLKFLKAKCTWKPSKEQMEFLLKYAEQNNYDGSILTSLYQDLKKLKG